eukprot:TRINITY_DN1614_c0_g1_i1.p1 TRINITY_DN1614_c0_g1~~TRINITY_DN1614_c0_g1_i1.p1  ORF type:complete len:385 (-),score=81.10 TRINITY_DN1614_c0_g1_i1:262-1257(-)
MMVGHPTQPDIHQGSSPSPLQPVSAVQSQGSAAPLRASVVQQASPLRSVGHAPNSPPQYAPIASNGSASTFVSPSAVQSQPILRGPSVQQPTQALRNPSLPIATHMPEFRTTAPNLGPSYTQESYEDKHKDDPQLQNLHELRRSSGLRKVPVRSALQAMHKNGNEGILTRDRFLCAYDEILKAQGLEPPSDQIRHAVFDLFDRDDNGAVDMMEIICGVSLLCEGSEDEKIHAVFETFDENGDGFISLDEMYTFLTSVFKVVLTPKVIGVMKSMGVACESAEDIASVTALECFRAADLNNDGKLSIVEFKEWFYAPRSDQGFLDSPVHKLLA